MKKSLQASKRNLIKLCFIALCFSFVASVSAQTGTWSRVKAPAPHDNMGVCVLMPNGTVLCHNTSGGGVGFGWDRLTPDIHGSYANGTWDTIAPNQNDRLFFSSQVLPNGKLYVAGGEYGAGGTNGEVYDPATNNWTLCGPIPVGWSLYDANSEILYNGNVLEGPQIADSATQNCLVWSPVTLNYTVAATALYGHDEAQWLKLKDSTILFVGIGTDSSNRYNPKNNTWHRDAALPVYLWDGLLEAGPGLMLPNGKSIFFGATPANVIYTPTGNLNPGTWAVADSFPTINGTPMGQSDAPAAMMVNGKILCAIAPSTNGFAPPTFFVEYDYTTNTFTRVMDTIPGMGGNDSIPIPSYENQMLDLPDGTVLLSMSQTNSYSKLYLIYTPSGSPIPQGKPTINNITETSCGHFRITGKLFNGISEGSAYGDDWQMATNYPLVRLTSGSNVFYATTSNWNRIGAVQTDSLEDTAYFVLPSMPGGTYALAVVANGFASNPTLFNVYGLSVSSQVNIPPCGGGLGSATVLAADGVAPYTYLWSPGGGTNASESNLSAGTYTVTATDNAGCTVSTTVTIAQTAALGVSINTTNISCNGGHNASLTAVPTGGTPVYTYSWTGGNTHATITGLGLGSYTVTVTDSCGNTATASTTITQPNAVSVIIDSVSNIPCYGYNYGSAVANVSPGTPPYTYSWSGGGGTFAGAYSLTAGTYTVTVTDSCGNTATASVTLTQPPALVVIADSINQTSAICNGKAWVNVSGGVASYSYLWNNSATTDSITGQCSGYYCCTVTDGYGCQASACVNIDNVTGLGEIQSGSGLVYVYPNPNNGVFQIQANGYQLMANSQIEVYDMLGERIVFGQKLADGQLQIDISNHPAGVYFYRVVNEDGSLIGDGKIILEK